MGHLLRRVNFIKPDCPVLRANTSLSLSKEVQMRIINLVFALTKVRVLRLMVLISSFAKVISLNLPLRFATFPLLQYLNYETAPVNKNPSTCDSRLDVNVDVLVSLYKFENFIPVLERSVHSCFSNPRITFHFVLVSGTTLESNWLNGMVAGTHHKVYRVEERIGIYKAWNLAISGGSGEIITNLNADDRRLPHSICSQASELQIETCDGSFGNFILSSNIFDLPDLGSGRLLVSSLGNFDEFVLVDHSKNLMHCAPMWRRSLHNKFGKFDESLKSAGDTDFWLRVMSGGGKFSRYEAVTAVYFHNPDGLSSSTSSLGHNEWRSVRDAYLHRKHLSNSKRLKN
jgi:hypothetical protein